MAALLAQAVHGLVHLCDNKTAKSLDASSFFLFSSHNEITYIPFADDFGPLNLASVSKFIDILKDQIRTRKGRIVVYCVENTPRELTNAVFLLGCFMVIELGCTSAATWECFKELEPKLEMYRDAQSSTPTFRLQLIDCWGGLERANNLGWVEEYDLDEYTHYNNPLEGDLHAIIPDKLIALRGPSQLGEGEEYRDVGGVRFFSPAFYVQPFRDMGVTTVIRLNSRPYDPAPFEAAGIHCLHVDLDEGKAPPPAAVANFLKIVSSTVQAGGAVAVHCKEGLGRTGTMMAAYLMAAHGFSAREAMGWLRVVRPGSVVASQQHFLCRLGEAIDRAAAPPTERPAVVAGILLSIVADAPPQRLEASSASMLARSASEGVRRADGRRARVRPQSAF
jgi:cell division cycle 14